MLITFLKQILRVRSGGFTMMEVMVATGLTGIASLAVMQLLEQTTRLQQESQVRSEIVQLRLLAKTILGDRKNCEATVMPNNVAAITRSTPNAVIPASSYINLPDGIQRFSKEGDKSAIVAGGKFGGRLDILSVELINYTPRTSSKVDVANSRIFDTGILEVRVRVNRKVYRAKPDGGQSLVDNVVSIETPVMVSLDTSNNIIGCIFSSNLTSQKITDETCKRFIHKGKSNDTGLEADTDSDVCSIAPTEEGQKRFQAHREMLVKEELCRSLQGAIDPLTKKCKHPWANFSCPNGYVISGFPEYGSRSFHCTEIPTIPTCVDKQVPQITKVDFDSTRTRSKLTYTCVTIQPVP